MRCIYFIIWQPISKYCRDGEKQQDDIQPLLSTQSSVDSVKKADIFDDEEQVETGKVIASVLLKTFAKLLLCVANLLTFESGY